jgi:hypothetical protein
MIKFGWWISSYKKTVDHYNNFRKTKLKMINSSDAFEIQNILKDLGDKFNILMLCNIDFTP